MFFDKYYSIDFRSGVGEKDVMEEGKGIFFYLFLKRRFLLFCFLVRFYVIFFLVDFLNDSIILIKFYFCNVNKIKFNGIY